MKIAICDECRQDAVRLQNMLSGIHDTRLYQSAEQLLTDVKDDRVHYDLYLLDIYLEVMDGIELAKQLRQMDEYGAVCFVSFSDAFYREAYDLYAVQYLLKPIRPEDIRKLLERVSKDIVRNRELSLYFKWRGKIGSIPYNKILYISSRGHTLSIHCRDGLYRNAPAGWMRSQGGYRTAYSAAVTRAIWPICTMRIIWRAVSW